MKRLGIFASVAAFLVLSLEAGSALAGQSYGGVEVQVLSRDQATLRLDGSAAESLFKLLLLGKKVKQERNGNSVTLYGLDLTCTSGPAYSCFTTLEGVGRLNPDARISGGLASLTRQGSSIVTNYGQGLQISEVRIQDEAASALSRFVRSNPTLSEILPSGAGYVLFHVGVDGDVLSLMRANCR